jgi:hypothetical protein
MGISTVLEMIVEGKSEQCKVRAALVRWGCEKTVKQQALFPVGATRSVEHIT